MRVLITFILLFSSNYIYSEKFHINLIEDCTDSCKPRTWYIKDEFKDEFKNQDFQIDDNWKKIDSFPIWVNQHYKHKNNLHDFSFITYFDLPNDFQLRRQTGIRFGEIGEVFTIYINGVQIAKEGLVKDNKIVYRRTTRGQIFEFDKELLKPKSNSLVIHIQGDPKYDHTGFYLKKGYDIGYFEELQYQEQDRITLILIGIYIVVGFYHLFLFLKRKKEKSNLYYSLYTIGLGVYLYTRTSAIFENHWDTGIIQKVELSVLYTMVSMIFLLLEDVFFSSARRVVIYFTAFNIILSILTIFIPLYFAEYLLRLWQISFLTFGVGLIVNILHKAIKEKAPNARRLLFGTILISLSAMYDIIDSLFLNSGIAFTKYTFFLFVFGFATVLANKFIQVHEQIEELNETLENKVEERTRELTESLVKVNELKKQQDGDYYLTSLLISPLGLNNSDKTILKVDFHIEQKKKFNFKGNDSEIGGDLCRTETIILKGKSYTVFFNSDAMGKSIQGAGGAIVMGAVFDSILDRTQLNKNSQDTPPERWLKNSFIELHKVFESFDCSMLVSVVIGLVDDATGLMYYICAEHPVPVLYRDGKASFLPVIKTYRKLGTPITDSDLIIIETFQIKYGDVVILGSDGRDDIMIEAKAGELELNLDEKLFLRYVEEGRGDVHEIARVIKETSLLTDDLSLMSLYLKQELIKTLPHTFEEIINIHTLPSEYQNEAYLKLKRENFLLSGNRSLYEMKLLILAYFNLKQYENAIRLAKEYIYYLPVDNYILYILSCAFKEQNQLLEAIELGERLRLRGVLDIENLPSLADSYVKIGNNERARYLLASLLLLGIPEDDKNKIRIKIEELS
jgi:hypothetical protein